MSEENKNFNEENIEENTAEQGSRDSEEPKVTVARKKRCVAKLAVICASIILLLALIGAAAYTALSYFVLFPSFTAALGNTLESKLDIGSEFKLSDLLDGGRITVEAEGMDGNTEDATFDLSYNSDGYVASVKLDRYEIDLAMTEKGMAYSSNKLNDGDAYGIEFKNIEQTLEGSALYYRNDGDYALTKDEFKAKLKSLEALAQDDDRVLRDLAILYDEISKAFEQSEMSEYDVAYGGIKIEDETRRARAKIYSFDAKDIAEFLEDAAERFEDASGKVEGAVERLAKTEIFELIATYIGYRVEDSDDLAELLEKLADAIDVNLDGASFDLVIGYVGRAVSVIQFKITADGDHTVVTLDFGADPMHEYRMSLSIVNVIGNGKTKTDIRYDVIGTDNGRRAKITLGNYVYTDSKKGLYEMDGTELYLDFDEKEGEVALVVNTVEEVFDGRIDEAVVWKTTDKEILFEYSDSRSELVLELVKATSEKKDVTPKGDYKITVSTKPDAVKLPKFENVFKMSERDYERYREDVDDFYKDLYLSESDGVEMIPEDFDVSRYFK